MSLQGICQIQYGYILLIHGFSSYMNFAMETSQFRFITLQQLESLVTLVEQRSFSDAARKMMLSQPSLSKHIKNLEIFVNCRLINRTKSGISLTKEGTILLGYARKILKLRDEARDKILSLEKTSGGHIFIGCSTIPSTYIFPALLTGLQKGHPDIRVHISSGDSEDVLEMVLDSRVEIGFIGKLTQDTRLHCEPVWDDELILVVPKGHRLEGAGGIQMEEIVNEPFILREKGSGTRQILEDHLRSQGCPPLSRFTIACELGSSEAVKEAVISGLGISILSIHAVKRELKQGLIVRVPIMGTSILRRISIIMRKQFTPPPQHLTFVQYAKGFSMNP